MSRFFLIYFTITGMKKIIRYTEDFVRSGSLYRGSTVYVLVFNKPNAALKAT